MFVKNILRAKGNDVFTIDQNVTLMEVVDEMVDRDCGSLVVTKEGRMVGIVTERDVLRASSECQRPLSETPLESAMRKQPLTVSPTDRVSDLMRTMTEKRIRHLPVVDDGNLVGLISIGDVVKAQEAELRAENRFLKEYIIG